MPTCTYCRNVATYPVTWQYDYDAPITWVCEPHADDVFDTWVDIDEMTAPVISE